MKRFGVRTFQAEDEIAAVCAALGASFGGGLGAVATSGPGMSLGAEALGLAVMTELPLVIIDIQRGGPSTGLPTKTEQADLLQALFGRHGECPAAVLAPHSPADCFATVYEAVRLAIGFMTPVIVLSDSYLANAAEPWQLPQAADLPPIPVQFAKHPNGDTGGRPVFLPYRRDGRLVREWAVPGTPGLEHRIGGVEKEQGTGNVSFDPADHEEMVRIRAQKIANLANVIGPLTVDGPPEGELLVIGWGSTHGAIAAGVERVRRRGLLVSHAHLRHLNPLPQNLGEVLRSFRKVLVPELNRGHLRHVAASGVLDRCHRAEQGAAANRFWKARLKRGCWRCFDRGTDFQSVQRLEGRIENPSYGRTTPLAFALGTPSPKHTITSSARANTHPNTLRRSTPWLGPRPLDDGFPMSAGLLLPTMTAADLATDQEVRWCPGCGDFSILAQLKRTWRNPARRARNLFSSPAAAARAVFRTTSTRTAFMRSRAERRPWPRG